MNNRVWIVGIVIALAIVFMSERSEGEANGSGPLVTTLAGKNMISGSADGRGGTARFSFAGEVTTDGTHLYVADTYNHTIRKVVIATGEVSTLAGLPGVTGSADGTGAAALFNSPKGIITDGTFLYIVDSGNCTVRKVATATSVVTTYAGTAAICGSTDGSRTSARFGTLGGITMDDSNLYVADTSNSTIRKIVLSTGVVATLAGSAMTAGFTDGIGAGARFNFASGITTDGTNLYVADTLSNTIRKIVIATEEVTTLAGTAGVTGSADGIASAARFNHPQGITTDGTSLYVADNANLTIRQVVISTGEVSTLAGKAGIPSSADGYGITAQFFSPQGIANVGPVLYVTDMGSIRKLQ